MGELSRLVRGERRVLTARTCPIRTDIQGEADLSHGCRQGFDVNGDRVDDDDT